MAKKVTETPLDGTPGPNDQSEVKALLGQLAQKMDGLHTRMTHTETALARFIQHQNTAVSAIDPARDKAQDDRIVARLAPVLLRVVGTLDKVTAAMEELPRAILVAGQESRDQIAAAAVLARRLMYAIEDEARARLQELRDEAVTDLKGLGNTGRNEMARVATGGLVRLENLAGHLASEMHSVADLSTELMTTVSDTAHEKMTTTAEAATAQVEILSQVRLRSVRLMASTVGTLEEITKDLRRIGPWLAKESDRRSWMIAGAAGLITGATICTVAAVCLSAMMRAGVVSF